MDDNLGGALVLAALVLAEFLFVLVARWLGWEPPPDEELTRQQAALREAMLERERSDPVPRSGFDKLLRRQMPLEIESEAAVGRLVSGGRIGARKSGAA